MDADEAEANTRRVRTRAENENEIHFNNCLTHDVSVGEMINFLHDQYNLHTRSNAGSSDPPT